jgi:hypothetical protein
MNLVIFSIFSCRATRLLVGYGERQIPLLNMPSIIAILARLPANDKWKLPCATLIRSAWNVAADSTFRCRETGHCVGQDRQTVDSSVVMDRLGQHSLFKPNSWPPVTIQFCCFHLLPDLKSYFVAPIGLIAVQSREAHFEGNVIYYANIKNTNFKGVTVALAWIEFDCPVAHVIAKVMIPQR